MLQGIAQAKHSAIDDRAKKDKAGVSYLVKLIEDNKELYTSIFDQERKISESELPEKLYTEVNSLIIRLSQEHCRVFGVITWSAPKGESPEDSATKLGWLEYKNLLSDEQTEKAETLTYLPFLTDKGKEIINGYRTARGYASLDKQREHNEK